MDLLFALISAIIRYPEVSLEKENLYILMSHKNRRVFIWLCRAEGQRVYVWTDFCWLPDF